MEIFGGFVFENCYDPFYFKFPIYKDQSNFLRIYRNYGYEETQRLHYLG